MRKRLAGLLVISVFLMFTVAAYAVMDDFVEGATKKLSRGGINFFSGWMELPTQILRGYNEGINDNKALGAVGGAFKGFAYFVGRTASGAMDFIGFWAADPKDNINVGFHLETERPWDDLESYDMLDPRGDRQEPDDTEETASGAAAAGNKFLRGTGNLLFGFLEIPNQAARGFREGNILGGIGKGLWYFASREVLGASDLLTFLLPTPKSNLGVPFDEEWPWDGLFGR